MQLNSFLLKLLALTVCAVRADESSPPLPDDNAASVVGLNITLTGKECTDQGGEIVGDIGDGAIFKSGFVCESSGAPPIATIYRSSGEPVATEGEVCCPGLAAVSGSSSSGLSDSESSPTDGVPEDDALSFGNGASSNVTMSRQECLNVGGEIVGDIGNGAVFEPDYVCESSGNPPAAKIVPAEGEPVAIEGEVCCTEIIAFTGTPGSDSGNGIPEDDALGNPIIALNITMSRQECLEQGGEIVGDIGNGAIFKPDYVCESSDAAPMAVIVPAEGEPVAIEGEVCCPSLAAVSDGTDSSGASNGVTEDDSSASAFVGYTAVALSFIGLVVEI